MTIRSEEYEACARVFRTLSGAATSPEPTGTARSSSPSRSRQWQPHRDSESKRHKNLESMGLHGNLWVNRCSGDTSEPAASQAAIRHNRSLWSLLFRLPFDNRRNLNVNTAIAGSAEKMFFSSEPLNFGRSNRPSYQQKMTDFPVTLFGYQNIHTQIQHRLPTNSGEEAYFVTRQSITRNHAPENHTQLWSEIQMLLHRKVGV